MNALHLLIRKAKVGDFQNPNQEKCSCYKRDGKSFDHKWSIKQGICANNDCHLYSVCPKRVKIETCSKSGKTDLFQIGDHNSEKFLPYNYGMSKKTKTIVDDLIYNYDSRPKRI